MQAIVLASYGGPEVLTLREVPDPVPGPEEIRVDVVATALNRADLLQRMGLYSGPPMAHEIPGMEFAGRVVELGERVTAWQVGDEVMGIVGGGAYAEQLVLHERQAMPVPEGLVMADAAAVPEVFLTAWDALVWQGGLTSGGRALVHAGASGVGTASIQLAKAIGARIAVTASTSKVAACEGLGADLVVDYTQADFAEEVTAWAPDGVDVVLDVIGGDYLNRNLRCTKVTGRIIQVGLMGSGRIEDFDLGTLLQRRIALVGTLLRPRPLEQKIAATQRFAAEVLPRFTDGSLKPVIDTRFPLSEAGKAHERMQTNANIGKLLLDVSE